MIKSEFIKVYESLSELNSSVKNITEDSEDILDNIQPNSEIDQFLKYGEGVIDSEELSIQAEMEEAFLTKSKRQKHFDNHVAYTTNFTPKEGAYHIPFPRNKFPTEEDYEKGAEDLAITPLTNPNIEGIMSFPVQHNQNANFHDSNSVVRSTTGQGLRDMSEGIRFVKARKITSDNDIIWKYAAPSSRYSNTVTGSSKGLFEVVFYSLLDPFTQSTKNIKPLIHSYYLMTSEAWANEKKKANEHFSFRQFTKTYDYNLPKTIWTKNAKEVEFKEKSPKAIIVYGVIETDKNGSKYYYLDVDSESLANTGDRSLNNMITKFQKQSQTTRAHIPLNLRRGTTTPFALFGGIYNGQFQSFSNFGGKTTELLHTFYNRINDIKYKEDVSSLGGRGGNTTSYIVDDAIKPNDKLMRTAIEDLGKTFKQFEVLSSKNTELSSTDFLTELFNESASKDFWQTALYDPQSLLRHNINL